MLACGGVSMIAGCSAFGSSAVPVSIDNNNGEPHTISVEVRRANEDTLFDQEVTLDPEESRTFKDALPDPSEVEILTANVIVDGAMTSRDFRIGGESGTNELIVNIKSDSSVTVFVAQS
jgi:hypothetical protein